MKTPAPKAGKAVASKPAVSPLPWTYEREKGWALISDDNGITVAAMEDNSDGPQQNDVDAALIITAVNSHAALVQALKSVLHFNNADNPMTEEELEAEVRAALKLAGQEE